MRDFPKKLLKKLEQRVEENSFRELPFTRSSVDFSSNDYLGLSREIWIGERTREMLNSSGLKNGATGSRLLSGNHQLYETLETQLTNFYNCDAALVFNSGYDANLGFFGSVPQRGDVIFYDELAHASIRDGIQLSNAKAYKFEHNNLVDLQAKIKLLVKAEWKTLDTAVYVVTESVFSMDGDSPDLKAFAFFCHENGCHLIVDEAHASGIFGNAKGMCVAQEITKMVFARIITFGKALGCHGAAILGNTRLKEYLVNFARSFIYTTALPPHTVASIIAAYEFLNSKNGNAFQDNLLENIAYFKQELIERGLQDSFIESNSAIQCMKVKGNQNVKNISRALKAKGYDVKAILSPTVPKGEERLRFCLHSYNTKEEIKDVIRILNLV